MDISSRLMHCQTGAHLVISNAPLPMLQAKRTNVGCLNRGILILGLFEGRAKKLSSRNSISWQERDFHLIKGRFVVRPLIRMRGWVYLLVLIYPPRMGTCKMKGVQK